MCGICGIAGELAHGEDAPRRIARMMERLAHRGPDDEGLLAEPAAGVWLGHKRLSILDLSAAGHQPMASASGRFELVLNGEIYNYLELRRELPGIAWRSGSDTETLVELWERDGPACLDRCRGMFALAIWDRRERRLWLARDRFGVKPLYYAFKDVPEGRSLIFAGEIPALFSAGAVREPDLASWAAYLAGGLYDHGPATFWSGIRRLPPGHLLAFSPASGDYRLERWYDPARAADAEPDRRADAEVEAELEALLEETVALRLRADVEVGICLSGGLDSSLLLGLLRRRLGGDLNLRSYTFYTGDAYYDELPWVGAMLQGTGVRPTFCRLEAAEVPELAARTMAHQVEPFGGLPTLAMAKIFAQARQDGVKVLLDGNGMDEAWAGYDYYRRFAEPGAAAAAPGESQPVQGSRSAGVLPEVLAPAFAALAEPAEWRQPFASALANAQLRDLEGAKLPRSLRFADRVSMASACELREPFLDHQLVELGLRQPAERKIRDGGRGPEGKWLVRQVARRVLRASISEAPKRPVQTPQREWLRGPLAGWAESLMEAGLEARPDFYDRNAVRRAFRAYQAGQGDNSFPVWQWLSVGMMFGQ